VRWRSSASVSCRGVALAVTRARDCRLGRWSLLDSSTSVLLWPVRHQHCPLYTPSLNYAWEGSSDGGPPDTTRYNITKMAARRKCCEEPHSSGRLDSSERIPRHRAHNTATGQRRNEREPSCAALCTTDGEQVLGSLWISVACGSSVQCAMCAGCDVRGKLAWCLATLPAEMGCSSGAAGECRAWRTVGSVVAY